MKIGMRTKVIILFLIAGMVPFAVTGIMSKRMATKSLEKQAFNQLVSIRETQKKQIEEYFTNIRKQLNAYSKDRMIINAMREFKDTFNGFRKDNDITDSMLEGYRRALKTYYTRDFTKEYMRQNSGRKPEVESYFDKLDDDSILLQYFYIKSNAYVLGEKYKLDFAEDLSTYSKAHANYHRSIKEFLEQFGYYDIFLVDHDSGNIVYSVCKELDFATSLKDGPYAKTNIGKAFQEANKSSNPNYVKLVDFSPYPPSYEGAASFIASPIFEGREKVGILIFQMPIDKINMVMTCNNDWKSTGLGESGETYLIGDDFAMRSQSRFLIEDEEGYFAKMKKLGMNQDILNIIKAKGSTILLQKINTKGTRAAVSGEKNVEIFPDYRNIPVLSAYAPLDIEDVKWAVMAEIDEAEALSAVTILAKRMLIISGFMIVLIAGLSYLVLKVTGRVTDVIKKTVSSLTECSNQISSASEHVSASSQSLAQNTSEQASSIEETSASMEEMSSMTKQNADNSEEAAKLVDMCSAAADEGNKAVEEVNNSMKDINAGSKKIAEITKVIDGIASQTNGLSLKASEETSQVIKQGNGFAVVAKEVRSLANRSTTAAKEIKVLVEDYIAKMEVESIGGEQNKVLGKIREVAEGIRTIERIAFETNLLALNAAVEAARSSDHGNKFAAIAEEVRNLAARSGDAAKDITALIGDSVVKAGNGVKVAGKCRKSLEVIVRDVKKALELTKGITNASKEQSEGINQVNSAVQQMDQITQQNAANAEETASSSEELSAQAQNMKEQINMLSSQVGIKGDEGLDAGSTRPKGQPKQQNKVGSSWRSIFKRKARLGTVKGNKDVKKNIIQIDPDDKVIPMGGNSIQEHDEKFKDF